MKKTLKLTLLALAGLSFSQVAAHAVTYTNGDIFLGFRASGGTGATQTYLLNIGQAAQYRDALENTSFTLDIGNIGVDLSSIYGANWYDRADLFWGVAGAITPAFSGDTNNTLYASVARADIETIGTPWNRRSNSAQAGTVSKIQGLSNAYNSGAYTATANSNGVGVIEGTGDANNWASFQPGGANANPGNVSFAAWNPTIEGNFGNSSEGSVLDLYRMTSSATAGLPGSHEGTFTINDSGSVTFAAPVPEPSSALFIASGFGVLGMLRRRRRSVA